eukprot:1195643-Prorocentrum_minimum.AAC.2
MLTRGCSDCFTSGRVGGAIIVRPPRTPPTSRLRPPGPPPRPIARRLGDRGAPLAQCDAAGAGLRGAAGASAYAQGGTGAAVHEPALRGGGPHLRPRPHRAGLRVPGPSERGGPTLWLQQRPKCASYLP